MSSPTTTSKQDQKLGGHRALHSLVGLALGLIAAVLVWACLQRMHPVFRVPKEYDVPSIGMPPERFAAFRRQRDFVDRKHAMLYLGALGLLVAAALAIREVTKTGSWLALLLAPPLGAAGGAAGGVFGCLVYEYVRAHVGQAELLHNVIAQLVVAVPLGLGIGLGLGLGTRTLGGTGKAALAGVMAGLLASALFPVTISVFFPAAGSDSLLPEESTSRLLWLAMLGGTIGLVIPTAERKRTVAPQPSPA